MASRFEVIDAFCGAGGLSLGFRNAGFRNLYSFDYDEPSIRTYTQNLGGCARVADIHGVTRESIEGDLGRSIRNIAVVAGGPPRQGFSVQRRGSDIDDRNNLVLEYIRLVLEIRPRFFLMENVSGLLSPRGKPYIEQVRRKTEAQGYFIHIGKLNAADFQVPQNRKRVFLIGELTAEGQPRFRFPEVGAAGPPLTVKDAIGDLMGRGPEVPNHRSDRLSPINLERIRALRPGQGRDSLPEHLQLECHKRNSSHRHLDVYGRMSWDHPSPTITARFDSFSRGRFGHPHLHRTITLREGARLQTFPDDFIFTGSKVEVAKQIGNAVPPKLGEAIARSIKTCL